MYSQSRNYDLFVSALSHHVNQQTSFVAALLDIDYFLRNLNNPTLDEYLKKIYECIKEVIPEKVIYLGRDEFAIITTTMRMEELFLSLSLANKKLKETMNISFSGGIAEYPKHGEDIIELLRQLEETLFVAKETSRNQILFADEKKMKLKSNYYTVVQLERLSRLSRETNRSEASLLRESLDDLLRKYEK
ncbi:diguanylate cyclase domain-containing protein [Brevibacillus gelatini]